MKINAKITLLFNEDGLSIELRDDDSSATFVRIKLNTKQTCQALSRLSHTDCVSAEVFGLEKLGKKLEVETITFPIDCDGYGNDRQAAAVKASIAACPEGWTPDNYFGSRDSFFTKDGKQWARCHIRRWVDK